jgi:hypothetical protein
MSNPIEHYVTIFDSTYLPQGIALYLSMERQIKSYCLWVICVDDKVYDDLVAIKFQKMRLLKLSSIETDDLLAVKKDRSVGEYCWTLTPFAPKFVFEADKKIERVTYIDADLWFFNSPQSIFDEFSTSNKAVMITDHSYSAEYDQSDVSGIYCVQFMIFSKGKSEVVRKWWEDKCLEWCYARIEEGRFGDQKYLDEWPKQFSEYVHVMQNPSAILAPWNATRYPYSASLIYHFHGLKILSKNIIRISQHDLPKALISYIYEGYIKDLKKSFEIMNNLNIVYTFKYSNTSAYVTILYQSSKRLLRNIIKIFPTVGIKF